MVFAKSRLVSSLLRLERPDTENENSFWPPTVGPVNDFAVVGCTIGHNGTSHQQGFVQNEN